jgi:hypothetical protein
MEGKMADGLSVVRKQWTSEEDPYEVAHARALGLRAMLQHVTGEGGEVFRNMREDMQDEYLATAEELADQLCDALSALPDYERKKVANVAA